LSSSGRREEEAWWCVLLPTMSAAWRKDQKVERSEPDELQLRFLKVQRATSGGLALYSASCPVQVRGQKPPLSRNCKKSTRRPVLWGLLDGRVEPYPVYRRLFYMIGSFKESVRHGLNVMDPNCDDLDAARHHSSMIHETCVCHIDEGTAASDLIAVASS
jgi:hypothetical protein